MPKIKLYLLGVHRIEADHQEIALSTQKAQALLAFLACK
jgi:DNA-binding SARP family transcriptional activator